MDLQGTQGGRAAGARVGARDLMRLVRHRRPGLALQRTAYGTCASRVGPDAEAWSTRLVFGPILGMCPTMPTGVEEQQGSAVSAAPGLTLTAPLACAGVGAWLSSSSGSRSSIGAVGVCARVAELRTTIGPTWCIWFIRALNPEVETRLYANGKRAQTVARCFTCRQSLLLLLPAPLRGPDG